MQNAKKFFCCFSPAKMHCEFTYTTNAFQDESWDLSIFICFEGSRSSVASSSVSENSTCWFENLKADFAFNYYLD